MLVNIPIIYINLSHPLISREDICFVLCLPVPSRFSPQSSEFRFDFDHGREMGIFFSAVKKELTDDIDSSNLSSSAGILSLEFVPHFQSSLKTRDETAFFLLLEAPRRHSQIKFEFLFFFSLPISESKGKAFNLSH